MVVRIGQKAARYRRVYFKEWREHRDLSQEQLAELLGTNKSGVSKMETGRTRYNQSSLEAWAKALRCEPADLISRAPGQFDANIHYQRASTDTRKAVERILAPDHE